MSASQKDQNPEIAEFLERNHVAVLATANKTSAMPHAAVVYYSVTSSFNLYFVTKDGTAKSKNIDSNPQVALAVYEAASQRTAQISGTAQRVNDPEKLNTALDLMAQHSQQTSQNSELPIARLDAGNFVLYRVIPNSIRLDDYKYGVSGQIFEVATSAEESLN